MSEERLEAIRRQLDADYARASKAAPPPAPRNKATRMVVGAVLLGCILGAAVAAIAMFFYLREPDAPVQVRSQPSQLKPTTTAPSPSAPPTIRSPTPPPAMSSTETAPGTTAATAATDRAQDARPPAPAAGSPRIRKDATRPPAHHPQAPAKPVEAP